MARAADMVPVVADTREQIPWVLGPRCFVAARAKLPAGDYALSAVDGWSKRIGIERKGREDFAASFGPEWPRFSRCVEVLGNTFLRPMIVVETTLIDAMRGTFATATPGKILVERVAMCTAHGVPVVFAGDRACAQAYVDAVLWHEQHNCIEWKLIEQEGERGHG